MRTMKMMKSKRMRSKLNLTTVCWTHVLKDVDDVKSALTSGGSIVATDEDERGGLSLACRREDWEVALPIVKLLLAKRFAPSMTDERGWNALHIAARSSSAEVVSLLLQKMQKCQ
jgi:ankyrin repeat protein